MTGFFLTIEGTEGVGKSTALKFIEKYLTQAKKDFILTREPGGTGIAEQIRKVLLTVYLDETLYPETELLLMFASRAQLIQQVIKPALDQNKFVVSDRFVDASFAYQGGGRQIDFEQITTLERFVVGDVIPNLTILLDAPPQIGLERAKHRGAHDRIEQEKIDFFERVRDAYLKRAHQEPGRFHLIDATQSLGHVESELVKILNKIVV